LITVQLLATKGLYLGIKVTLYNPLVYEDSGVFLTVNLEDWKNPAYSVSSDDSNIY